MKKILLILVTLTIIAGLNTPNVFAEAVLEKSEVKEMGKVNSNMALVYIIRPASTGSAVRFWTYVDKKFVGVNKGRTYFFTYVSPGSHLLWAKAENTSFVQMDFKKGQTYYFKEKVAPGFFKANVKLREIDEAKAKKYLEKCKYVTPTAYGKEKGNMLGKKFYSKALRNSKGEAPPVSKGSKYNR